MRLGEVRRHRVVRRRVARVGRQRVRHRARIGRLFFFSSRRRHTRSKRDWSSDVCSSDLSLDNSDGALMPGMNGQVVMDILRRDNVVAVPSDAIRNARDAATVAPVLGVNPDSLKAAQAAARAARGFGGVGGTASSTASSTAAGDTTRPRRFGAASSTQSASGGQGGAAGTASSTGRRFGGGGGGGGGAGGGGGGGGGAAGGGAGGTGRTGGAL